MSVNTKVNGQLVKSAGLYKASVPIQSGDIYSLEERQIGVWADGKPLYQKTIAIEGAKTIGTTWTDIAEIPNVDKMDSAEMTTGAVFSDTRIRYQYTNGKLQAVATSSLSLANPLFTVRYTKTTDVAGSGEYVPSGDKAVHYSTEEQVIGTWIDGSTLYEKTIDIGALPNSATSKSYAHGITGNIVRYDISAIDASGTVIQLPFYTTATNYNIGVYVTNTNIVVETQRDSSGYTHCYATLRYTKSS